MRVFLLNPPYPLFSGETKFASPPLGLAYIASVLRKSGHEVLILDSVIEGYSLERDLTKDTKIYGLTKEMILEKVKSFNPDVVGISCIFSTLHNIVLDLADFLKQNFLSLKIVLGGTHATVYADKLMESKSIDFIVRGEGEYAMLGLLDCLGGKKNLGDIDNLVWRDNDSLKFNPQKFIDDIDQLPYPARDLLNMEAYRNIGILQGATHSGSNPTTVITSRGCPANCVFCSIHSVWGKKFRAHSVDYVLAELKSLKQNFAINYILFEDDNITFDRQRAERIFQGMIDNNFQFRWTAPNGVAIWCLDEKLLSLIKKSGCEVLFLAVESGDQDTLKNIVNKPLDLQKAKEIINVCRKLKIKTQAFFVIGLVGETIESMNKSMGFAKRLNVDRISIAVATPYPGTRLYDICKEKGFLSKDFDITRLMTRSGQICTNEFSPKDVEKIASAAYIGFSLRHPFKTISRILEKILVDPKQTFNFIFKRLGSVIKN